MDTDTRPNKPQHALVPWQPPEGLAEWYYQPQAASPSSEQESCTSEPAKPRWWANLKGYGKWWLIFSGIYASSSVCPFCGKPGCPVGPGAASLIGLVFAWLMHSGRHLRQRFQTLLASLRG